MAGETNVDAKPNEHRGTLPAGARLRNYELVSILGHGGFGITYYARDTTLGREVAVKEYLPTSLALREDGSMVVPRSTQLAEDFTWGRDRFLEEARILATLEGVPSIVRVYDFLEANGTAYMVMGLARGETLDQRLKSVGKLPATAVERLLRRLLDGLEEVHKAGFLHRDIKPANIILDDKDRPTLIDFGASRAAMADRTAAMTAIFTPRYAAAEQLTSDKQGPWTDIYGLSATVYHAITGQAPPSSLERALNDTYEPLTRLSLAGFPHNTLQGIDAGLTVRPKDRPQSIAAWRGLLFPADVPAGDSTVIAARPKPAVVIETAASATPSSTPDEPSKAAATPDRKKPVGGRRLGLYSGVLAVVLVLAAGGYLAFAPKPAPSTAPVQQAKAERDDEAAKARAETEARLQAEAERKAQAEAEQKAQAEADARRKAQAEAERQAAAEGQQKAADAARQKAEAEAQQKAQAAAEAERKAAAEAQQKAEAQAQQTKAAEAQQQAEEEARRKAEADAWQKKEAEAMAKAEAEARQKAEADAAAQKTAEATEAALGLSAGDRRRIQVALTSLGFDTRGADGVFGPRSREMILGWQRARGQAATSFLTAAQEQTLFKEAAPALAKYDQDQRTAEEARRRDEAAARARPTAPPPPYGGVACQDPSGRRLDFPNATSCPYGLRPLR